MLTTRFYLRSLMILVALAAVGSWIAITIWRKPQAGPVGWQKVPADERARSPILPDPHPAGVENP